MTKQIVKAPLCEHCGKLIDFKGIHYVIADWDQEQGKYISESEKYVLEKCSNFLSFFFKKTEPSQKLACKYDCAIHASIFGQSVLRVNNHKADSYPNNCTAYTRMPEEKLSLFHSNKKLS